MEMGSVHLREITLHTVLHVPNLGANLISVPSSMHRTRTSTSRSGLEPDQGRAQGHLGSHPRRSLCRRKQPVRTNPPLSLPSLTRRFYSGTVGWDT